MVLFSDKTRAAGSTCPRDVNRHRVVSRPFIIVAHLSGLGLAGEARAGFNTWLPPQMAVGLVRKRRDEHHHHFVSLVCFVVELIDGPYGLITGDGVNQRSWWLVF